MEGKRSSGEARPVGRPKRRKQATAPVSPKKGKRRKTQKRCTSPSHLLVPEAEELKFGPRFGLTLPARDLADALLRAVSNMYYKEKEVHPNGTSVWVSTDYGSLHYPSLDLLLSPLRQTTPLDFWAPKEIAIFEAAICRFGKDFHRIHTLVKTKNTNEVVDFYYRVWKKSRNYRIWKDLTRPEVATSTVDTK